MGGSLARCGVGGKMSRVHFDDFEIESERIRLRPWRLFDGRDFAWMNADVEVMANLGGPLSRAASDQKLDRFRSSLESHRVTRWVVTDPTGRFLGYCGIVAQPADHPLGERYEIGWRLTRDAWGHGYATEVASVALRSAFDRLGCDVVLRYPSHDNLRSQAVLTKLGLERSPSLDFNQHYDGFGSWNGLVWAAPSGWTEPSNRPADGDRR